MPGPSSSIASPDAGPVSWAARVRAVDPSRYVVYVGFLLIFGFFAVTLQGSGFLTSSNLINIVSFQSRIISARFSRLFVK